VECGTTPPAASSSRQLPPPPYYAFEHQPKRIHPIRTTCGTTLAAGLICTISVTFTPASAASFTATLSVADNAAGSLSPSQIGLGASDSFALATGGGLLPISSFSKKFSANLAAPLLRFQPGNHWQLLDCMRASFATRQLPNPAVSFLKAKTKAPPTERSFCPGLGRMFTAFS
jgi:hypothetical protein